jgi:hypothetical protein
MLSCIAPADVDTPVLYYLLVSQCVVHYGLATRAGREIHGTASSGIREREVRVRGNLGTWERGRSKDT